MRTELWSELDRRISAALGSSFVAEKRAPVSGGCINECHVVASPAIRYFVKFNRRAGALDMFAAERDGLEALSGCDEIRLPTPLCHGEIDGTAYLVLEYLRLQPHGDQRRAGRALASLHRLQGRYFGWKCDNNIGATHQRNTRSDDWVRFWSDHRLGYQLDLAADQGHDVLAARGRRLQERLGAFFTSGGPSASLLHGDLWSGNFAWSDAGEPVLFDPAVYFGDREADLAMTELFGGFSSEFYAAYDDAWPLASEYATRRTLYNLYHVLNHLHLFGGGYLRQASTMVDQLLAELG